MASVFPELLNYSQIAPFIIRMASALVIIKISLPKIAKFSLLQEKILGLLEISSSLFIIIGFLTQPAALVLAALILFESIKNKIRQIAAPPERKFLYFILIISMASLAISGPGLFAIDFPL